MSAKFYKIGSENAISFREKNQLFLMSVSSQIQTNLGGPCMQVFPFYVDLVKQSRGRGEICFKDIFLILKLSKNPVFGVQASFLQQDSPVSSVT